ncbi:unnamed protein product [Rotaria sp. Silwood2]|nr:unnamed protein product [Rotaria sp. Silwood2]CAF3262169.1 unnamed protein product [Rotaria sp. Silwood2]
MPSPQLNKQLYTSITRLKLLNTPTSNPKFVLEKSPFDENSDDEEMVASREKKDIVIVGRIFPDSEVFREGSFKIKMKITSTYPYDPSEVYFLTPIYHPNVSQDGKFCYNLLRSDQKFCNRYWQFYKPINIQEVVAWINSGMSCL